jgi:hypothetical protein
MQVNEADGQSRGQIAHHGPERDAIVEGQRMEVDDGEATGPLGVRRAAALTLLHTYIVARPCELEDPVGWRSSVQDTEV